MNIILVIGLATTGVGLVIEGLTVGRKASEDSPNKKPKAKKVKPVKPAKPISKEAGEEEIEEGQGDDVKPNADEIEQT